LIITYIYADTQAEWNCAEWRIAIPARAINRTKLHQAHMLDINSFINNSQEAQELCNAADIIVIQRNLFGPVLAAIQRWKARDKVVIVDFDDAYDLIPSTVKSSLFWKQGIIEYRDPDGKLVAENLDPPPLTQFKWGMRLVHAATVPATRLADDWRAYTDIHLLPNYAEMEKYQNITPKHHEGIHIGWGGSVSHFQSFTGSGVITALKNICRVRPQVKILICGGDQRIYNELPVPPEQKILVPWVAQRDWPQQLANFDIGIAPLSGPYDDRRSWVKVLEYMIMKIPWVASEGPAYTNLRQYGWLVKNTSNAWERVLLDIVDHLDAYKSEAARDAYLFGISQGIDENIEKVINTYSKIIEKAQGGI